MKAQADGAIKTKVQWSVAMKRAKLKGMAEGPLKQLTQALEKVKAQIRARVEHPFHVVKKLFNHKKARYRGLAKNGAQYDTLFALGN
ncbi:Mobile element protein [Caballeronia sordidicola]|uniref:Mobile element protein n=1 Tax=Caballeronia sordidicola TaxID=196367 RepID=A0A226WX07_CABSO|nr:Mobile element protein [Caballeronia sordidicola]